MFRTSTTAFLAATFLTCSASNVTAQMVAYKTISRTMSVAKTDSRFMGNAVLGGYTFAGVRLSAQKTGGRARADSSFRLSSHARFLNQSKRMSYFRATAHSDNYTSRRNVGSAYVYLSSDLILSRSFSGRGAHAVTSHKSSLDLFPKDLAEPFSIAGIPITVRGNVGVGMHIEPRLGVNDGQLSLAGNARTWGYGKITATCGVRGAYAHAESTAYFANQRVDAFTSVDAKRWRFAASVNYSVKAIILKLKASVTHVWKRSRTLAHGGSLARSLSLLRL